jgi:hypothetical protein
MKHSEESTITIFCTPKPMRGHNGIIQRNAIQSWTLLQPACEIILFGNDEGVAEIAAEYGLRHVPDVACNEFGTPLLSDMFVRAQQLASYDLICYINADIILMSDFLHAAQRMAQRQQPFFMVGRRWDLDITEPLAFGAGWEPTLRAQAQQQGRLHGPSGIDYMVFPRGLIRDLPEFAVGRPGWDNWLIYHLRSRHIAIIDATMAVAIVHQNHDYRHVAQRVGRAWMGPEGQRNLGLVRHPRYLFNIRNATWLLTPRMLVPALTPHHIQGYPRALRALYPFQVFIGIRFWKRFFPAPFRFAVRQIFRF